MQNVIEKCVEGGNSQIILCERGNSFGYNNLVVDMLNFQIMKDFNVPVIFDATHSLQLPGGLGNAAGGRREFLLPIAKAGVSQCIAGLFIEAHPNPDEAKCDGPCAISSDKIFSVLSQLSSLDKFIKEQENKNQRLWIISIAGALLFALILSFILFRNSKNRQKSRNRKQREEQGFRRCN